MLNYIMDFAQGVIEPCGAHSSSAWYAMFTPLSSMQICDLEYLLCSLDL